MKMLTFFLSGMLFAAGLVVSGMTNTKKVIGFLDIFGDWDPSLLFVMVGAIGTHAFFYYLLKHKTTPLFSTQWHLPTNKKIDTPLVLGATLFGAGWGLAGICPGPALTTVAAVASQEIIFFTVAMISAMVAFHFINKQFKIK